MGIVQPVLIEVGNVNLSLLLLLFGHRVFLFCVVLFRGFGVHTHSGRRDGSLSPSFQHAEQWKSSIVSDSRYGQ